MSGSEPEPDDRGAGRMLALGATAWAAMGFATADDPRVLGVVAAVTGLVAIAAWRRTNWFLASMATVAAVCVVVGGARAAAVASDPVTELTAQRATGVVEVRVSGAGRWWAPAGPRPGMWRGTAELVSVDARGGAWRSGAPVQVVATGEVGLAWAAVPMGATVRATVRFGAADAGSGLFAELRARESPVVVAEPDVLNHMVGSLRRGLVEACTPLWPDARALVPALVVGDTSAMPDDLRERFVVTGLTHLTAVSGSNLTLLLGFLRAFAVGCGVRGRWLLGLQVGGVAGFVLLCLGEPSVLRAAAMGLVGLAALGRAGRGRHGLRFLGVAVLAVVLAEPAMSRSLGFALSVLATFGLLRWAGAWADLLARWLPRWCAETLAVPLAAQVATEPVVVVLSGQVSVVSVLANLVAGPMVGPATVLGLITTLVAPVVGSLAVAPAWAAGWFAQGIAWTARLGEALPGAAVPWPASAVAVGVVVLGCGVLVLLAPVVLPRRWLFLGLAGLVLLGLGRTPTPPGWPPRGWAVASCDVGQGDATVLAAGPGQAVVVDTGPDPAPLSRCLAQLGVSRVPVVVLTHLHADHVGGADALAGLGVDLLVTSGVRTPEAAHARAVAVLAPAQHVEAGPGSAWQIGDVRLEVLAAPALGRDLGGEGESSAENDASLLLRADVAGVSVLLAGDAEEGAQTRHLGLRGALDVDVLLVPHHGSGRHSPAFVAASRPDVALVSVGEGNDYGHPAARTLASVNATGAATFRTDERGSITVARAPDGGLAVTTQR
ncbi:ComEC/Rec2 family competence protein [Propioniciclava sinopodophylli]|uniref:ComEC/Rec2 family competence protein n=1 Tax=Propioniciclava sinopodophylli TaxID=1837344 RepID=A0A4Q9KDR3_9ACTN|nr:ComEC/Rec2 family competence protein [Propioniciclava sinopodophylli]TBT83729.1 ComEC/Rec2 family competence protein [Propioniciclava sinopodophylli]